MKQTNTLFGIIAGVAFTLPYAVASETPTAVNGENDAQSVAQIMLADNSYSSSKTNDDAVIGGDAPNPEPDRSVSQTAEDAAITAKVKTNLLADATVGGLKIDADTRNGVVYLTSSHMKSQAEIDKAIQVAKATSGVKDVVSKLSVGEIH